MPDPKNTIKRCLVFGMVILLAACSPAAASPSRPSETSLPTAAFSSSTTPAPTATALPATSASSPTPNGLDSGFWLVVQTGQGVDAFNRDSGRRLPLLKGLPAGQAALLFAPQKSDGWFALLDGQKPSLLLFRAPDTQPKKEIPLLSAAGIEDEKRSAYLQTMLSREPAAAVWSPDGGRLAFLAAIDHPYLELYLLDTGDLSVSRLSEGGQDIFQPVWSPDSQWIVYDETDGLNTVGLWAVTAVKAVRANASQSALLYQPESYAEPLLGWSSPTSLIVHSARDHGPVDLREVKVETGEASMIYSGDFQWPVFDGVDGLAAFVVTDSFTDPTAQPPGIYTGSASRPARLMAAGSWSALAWNDAAGLFFAVKNNSTAAAFTAGGQAIDYKDENSLPTVSLSGDRLAFSGGKDSALPGLRLYDAHGKRLSAVTSQPVESAAWLPDGALIFSDGANLYSVLPSGGQPALLIEKAAFLGWLDFKAAP